MKHKTISISSDSEEDNLPLKAMKVKQNGFMEDPNAYSTLCKHRIEACEFCDRISSNRYSSLIHNVSHIIIPLLKQTVFECSVCLHSFTSRRDLRTHALKKHPGERVELKPLVNQKSTRTSQTSHVNARISQTSEPNLICVGTKMNETIKNRLVFEEEDDDPIILDCTSDRLLNDLTTDCKVNLEVFNTPWVNGSDEFSGKSVHYDDLVKPGVYRCKKCGKGFPIRYDAIVHESTHIKIKNSQVSLCVICKKYLVGGKNDLRHHYLTFHKPQEGNPPEKDFISKLIFEEDKKIFESKLINLCDLCFSFCKSTLSIHYEYIKNTSEMGKRYECEKCGQLFFEINVVKRSLQRRALYGSHAQKKRKKTNEDRLKTIANRFKMMKH